MGGFYLGVKLHQEGSALQPAQQACLLFSIVLTTPGFGIVHIWLYFFKKLEIPFHSELFNRPGVAGAVLQSPLSLTD